MPTIDLSKTYFGQQQAHKLSQIIVRGIPETPDTTAVVVDEKNEDGFITAAHGTTVPTNDEAGFAKGCEFLDTNAVDGEHAVWENIGDEEACEFDNLGSIAAAEVALAEGFMLRGGASDLAEAFDASTTDKFVVGDGTKPVMKALSAALDGAPVFTGDADTPTGTNSAPAFTGTSPASALNLATPAFSGTGLTAVGQDITTTDNQTMSLNECAGMWLIPATGATPPVLILSNTAVTGAPAVLTVQGVAMTDAGAYKIVKSLTPVGTVAAPVFTGDSMTPTGTITEPGVDLTLT